MRTLLQDIDHKDRHPPTDHPPDPTHMTLLLPIRQHLPTLPEEITRLPTWHADLPRSGALLKMDAPMVVSNITQSQDKVTIVNIHVLALHETVQICPE